MNVISGGQNHSHHESGEQHAWEDLGRIPTLQDWLVNLKPAPWMYGQTPDLGKQAGKHSPD